MIDVNYCLICDKEIPKNRKYCSQECYNKSKVNKRTGIYRNCLTCGEEIYVKPSQIDTKFYCCVKCWTQSDKSKKIVSEAIKRSHILNTRIGEHCNSWRGGTTKSTRERTNKWSWRKLRLKILDRDKYKCRRCGFSGKRMHVHHLIPICFGGNDNEDNLVTLCEKCHPHVENRTINKILKTAVKKKCISCKGKYGVGGIKADIRGCTAYDCQLYHVRPYQKKNQNGV